MPTATMTPAVRRYRTGSEYDGIVQGHQWRRNPMERDSEWCEGCGMRLGLRRQDGQVRGVMVVTPGLPASQAHCSSGTTQEGGFFLMNDVTGHMDRVTEQDWEGHGRMFARPEAVAPVSVLIAAPRTVRLEAENEPEDRVMLGEMPGG